MRLTLADSDPSLSTSNRVLALATRAASSISQTECCLLFDKGNSLKRFTAMCNGY
jgi:hypothetical protein